MKAFVTTPHGQVHYRHEGESGPVVVLFHESPISGRIYERTLPYLGKAVRAYALDTPGYGLSDPPETQIEIPEYVSRLLEAIDALGIDKFAAGGGHTGASLAAEIARQAPDRVTHVILSGVPLFTAEEREKFLTTWAPDVELDDNGDYLDWAWRRYRRIWHKDSPADITALGAHDLLSVLPRYNWGYNAAFRFDPEPSVAALTCKVLLLNPEFDLLAMTDPRVMEMLPHAQFVQVPELKGQLPARDPERYANEIIKFVTS